MYAKVRPKVHDGFVCRADRPDYHPTSTIMLLGTQYRAGTQRANAGARLVYAGPVPRHRTCGHGTGLDLQVFHVPRSPALA